MPADLHIERRDEILLLTLDDPETRNAIAREIYEKATAAIVDAGNDPSVRAIVLTGANGVFCSGGNVGNFPERRKQPRSVSHRLGRACCTAGSRRSAPVPSR